MINWNLRKKIQNLISGQKKGDGLDGESGYRDLTPESDTKNSEEYIRALHWAIKNKDVKNIALSGPYGSGKSSVIKTYLKKYPKTKYLSISLAAFSTPTKSVNGEDDKTTLLADDWTLDDVDENVIEEGILKQLFYRVDVGKIPQSRYRKIKKLSYWKMFFTLLMLTVVASAVYLEINPNVLEDFKNTVINNGAFFHLNQWLSYAVFTVTIFGVLLLITTVLKYVMSNFRIANINLGDKASISKKEEKESIFDKSLDEIVYFFESTTYDTVFIEDLDRFNQPNIFIKLRELNTVINNYDNIKRKVVFIYAIKDDIFKDEERTKFFDFIVPVIPYINATNSVVKSEKTDKIDNECIKNIIINPEITVQAVGQIVDNYNCDEEIEFNVSKLPEDKIYVLIRKHYIRYSLSNTEKIKSNAIDGFGIYCREYIDQFINDLPSVSLNESEVVMLLNDTTIDKHFKPEILKKISAGIMTKKLAQTIASNQFDVDKVYVERAWKFLDNTERHMLLVYHLQVYSVAEISRLLMELGGEWSKLSDNKSRHKEEISIDVNGHNERLLLQLQKKGFITSYQEKNDRKKRCFEVWVKQQ